MHDKLTRAVKTAIGQAPCSMKKLADTAGVPHSTLSRIKDGILGATPDVASKVARALERWGDNCHKAAGRIRNATKED
jgi:hypothetical protein